jgi:DNA helicase INO80
MLRRLKDDIELEIGPKQEFTHTCLMTHRQKVLYQRIKNKISTKDLFSLVESKAKMENLMNLVMQFRKVCNHPELFERRIGRIPLTFKVMQVGMQPNPFLQSVPELRTLMRNPISFEVPKLVYDESFMVTDNQTRLFRKLGRVDSSMAEVSVATHMAFFNIFNTEALVREGYSGKSSLYSSLHLMTKGHRWSHGQLSWLCVADSVIKQVALLHYHLQRYHRRFYKTTLMNETPAFEIKGLRLPSDRS